MKGFILILICLLPELSFAQKPEAKFTLTRICARLLGFMSPAPVMTAEIQAAWSDVPKTSAAEFSLAVRDLQQVPIETITVADSLEGHFQMLESQDTPRRIGVALDVISNTLMRCQWDVQTRAYSALIKLLAKLSSQFGPLKVNRYSFKDYPTEVRAAITDLQPPVTLAIKALEFYGKYLISKDLKREQQKIWESINIYDFKYATWGGKLVTAAEDGNTRDFQTLLQKTEYRSIFPWPSYLLLKQRCAPDQNWNPLMHLIYATQGSLIFDSQLSWLI